MSSYPSLRRDGCAAFRVRGPLFLLVLSLLSVSPVSAQSDNRGFEPKRPDRASLEYKLLELRQGLKPNLDDLSDAVAQLSARGLPQDVAERKELAREWRAAAQIWIETEGHTPSAVEALELAAQLDPENASLASEAAYQRQRLDIVEARIRKAAEARSSRADGASEE